MDVTINLSTSMFSADDAFDMRVEAIERGNVAEEVWGSLNESHQEILLDLVRQSLLVMFINADKFVPNVISEFEPGLKVDLSILLSQIEEEVGVTDYREEALLKVAEMLGFSPDQVTIG